MDLATPVRGPGAADPACSAIAIELDYRLLLNDRSDRGGSTRRLQTARALWQVDRERLYEEFG